jgi:fructose-specific phosphotransferase system IIA component
MTAQDIKISALIKEKTIELELKSTDKKKVIAELVDVVARSGKLKDKKDFLRTIIKREKLGSTGIGNGVAIPHSRSLKVKDFILAFARQDKGVDFGALDGEKTYLFFMLASPEANVGGHLKVLAEISRLVKDKFLVDRLKGAKDKKQALGVIAAFDK